MYASPEVHVGYCCVDVKSWECLEFSVQASVHYSQATTQLFVRWACCFYCKHKHKSSFPWLAVFNANTSTSPAFHCLRAIFTANTSTSPAFHCLQSLLQTQAQVQPSTACNLYCKHKQRKAAHSLEMRRYANTVAMQVLLVWGSLRILK